MKGNMKQKTTMNLDKDKLAEAREATGAGSDVDTVHMGLDALIRSAAYQRMRTFLGSEKGRPIYDVPRRREAGVEKKRKTRARKSA